MTVVTIQGAHTLDLVIMLLGGFAYVAALASTQYPEIRIGDSALQKRLTFDHLLVQSRLVNGAALSVEVAGGRPPETPFRLEIIGKAVLVLEGGAPRGFQSGRLRLLLDGQLQQVDEGEDAGMSEGAANVAAVYAALRDDIANGTTTAPNFQHAVRLAKLIDDVTASSRDGCASRRRAGLGQLIRKAVVNRHFPPLPHEPCAVALCQTVAVVDRVIISARPATDKCKPLHIWIGAAHLAKDRGPDSYDPSSIATGPASPLGPGAWSATSSSVSAG